MIIVQLFCCSGSGYVAAHGDGGGEVGDEDADDDEYDGDEEVPLEVAGVGEGYLELVACHPYCRESEQRRYEAAEGAVGDAADDEASMRAMRNHESL